MSELYNDREYFDMMFGSIDNHFIEVKKRLDKLNGAVASHEKIITENLPHSIAHCPQQEAIKDLQENMITSRAVKKTIYITFGIVCTLIAALWSIMEILK